MDRLARSNQAKTTADVMAHVDRAKDTLKNIHAGNLSSDEVFIHPQMQLVSLKVAREELNLVHPEDVVLLYPEGSLSAEKPVAASRSTPAKKAGPKTPSPSLPASRGH